LPFDKPEPPLFLERFEEERVPEKGTLRLLARVTGNPTPVITWLRYVQQKQQHSCLVEQILTLFHGMLHHKQFRHKFVRYTEEVLCSRIMLQRVLCSRMMLQRVLCSRMMLQRVLHSRIMLQRVLCSRMMLQRVLCSRMMLQRVLRSRIMLQRVLCSRMMLQRVLCSRMMLQRVLRSRIMLQRVLCSRMMLQDMIFMIIRTDPYLFIWCRVWWKLHSVNESYLDVPCKEQCTIPCE